MDGVAVFGYGLIINLWTFFLFSWDKVAAKTKKRRVREKTLLLFALIGGSIGAFTAMYVFRHKTAKKKFTLGVPFFFLFHIALFFYWCGLFE